MAAQPQPIDNPDTIDLDALIERVAERVEARARERALRIREAMLAELRAFEDMFGLPRSLPTWAERNPGSNRGGKHVKKHDD